MNTDELSVLNAIRAACHSDVDGKIDLDLFAKLCELATPGPWESDNGAKQWRTLKKERFYDKGASIESDTRSVCIGGYDDDTDDGQSAAFGVLHNEDAAFIAEARTAAPVLVQVVNKIREILKKHDERTAAANAVNMATNAANITFEGTTTYRCSCSLNKKPEDPACDPKTCMCVICHAEDWRRKRDEALNDKRQIVVEYNRAMEDLKRLRADRRLKLKHGVEWGVDGFRTLTACFLSAKEQHELLNSTTGFDPRLILFPDSQKPLE